MYFIKNLSIIKIIKYTELIRVSLSYLSIKPVCALELCENIAEF